jgi:hypothetical protein
VFGDVAASRPSAGTARAWGLVGTLSKSSESGRGPGEGDRLLRLSGEANPLALPPARPKIDGPGLETGATTSTWSTEPAPEVGEPAFADVDEARNEDGDVEVRIAAAESRTEGTDCSSCSVFLARGIR